MAGMKRKSNETDQYSVKKKKQAENISEHVSKNESTIADEPKRKNCMKHKKKDKSFFNKKNKKQKKDKDSKKNLTNSKIIKTVEKKERILLPREASEISCNWKQLLMQSEDLKKERKDVDKRKGKKRKHIKKEKSPPPQDTKEEEKEEDIWFDNVDEFLIEGLKKKKKLPKEEKKDDSHEEEQKKEEPDDDNNPLVKQTTFTGLTKAIAMDCEMVGVGEEGKDSVLARVSLVNQFGKCIYDKFVKASETVTDYRTAVSGIRPQDMENGEDFSVVQKEVFSVIKGRILVGHALSNDLKVLFLDHPRKMIRDTVNYKPFRALFKGRKPALRKLAAQLLQVPIQTGEHSSVQDAQAAMRLYTMHRKQWEKEIASARSAHRKKNAPATK